MDIVIIDDEFLARERLRRMLADYGGGEVVAQAANSDEAKEAVLRCDPDVVLLDIHMPGDSGLTFAQWLQELDDAPAIIFCTAHQQHALQAFDVSASDYLLKPVRKEKLFAALDKAKTLNKAQRTVLNEEGVSGNRRSHVSAKTHNGIELIPIDQVHLFSAEQKYVTAHHQQGQVLIDDTLKELEAELVELFVRVHRNALVSIRSIVALEKKEDGHYCLRLSNSDLRPSVSRRHMANLRKLLTQL
jgi:two-component system response regulator AlgR